MRPTPVRENYGVCRGLFRGGITECKDFLSKGSKKRRKEEELLMGVSGCEGFLRDDKVKLPGWKTLNSMTVTVRIILWMLKLWNDGKCEKNDTRYHWEELYFHSNWFFINFLFLIYSSSLKSNYKLEKMKIYMHGN